MIDDEIERDRGRDALRIAAEPGRRVAHRRQVAERRYACGVVHHHARRTKPDFALRAAVRPREQRGDVAVAILASGALPQQIFEHDFERVRQTHCARAGRRETAVMNRAGADREPGQVLPAHGAVTQRALPRLSPRLPTC